MRKNPKTICNDYGDRYISLDYFSSGTTLPDKLIPHLLAYCKLMGIPEDNIDAASQTIILPLDIFLKLCEMTETK